MKIISIRKDVYERLEARRRDSESFTDLIERLLNETKPDWREEFDTLSEEEADELENVISSLREES